jgi:hypothetical protein
MDKKSILKKIQDIMTFSTEEEVKQFLDAKTIDGVIVRTNADAFVVGDALFVITEDGEIAAPAGEHTLEDGTILVTDEGGTLLEVRLPEVALEDVEEVKEMAEEETTEEKEEEMEEEVKEEEKIAELTKRLEAIEEMVKKMAEEEKEDYKAFSNAISDKIDSFIKDTPAQLEFKSIKSEYNSGKEIKKNTELNNLDRIKSLRKK